MTTDNLAHSYNINMLIPQAGGNANMLDRCSSFTQKVDRSLFKIKGSKKVLDRILVCAYVFCAYRLHCHGQD